MRTTLTLDDDVAAKLQAEVRRTGKSFKEVVNEHLRISLLQARATKPRKPFKIEARSLGGLRPGLSYDNIEALIEAIEGPMHR